MKRSLRPESRRLQRSWDRYSSSELDTYLVAGVEDPRINLQSILTRGLIADTLFPGRFDALINEEWRFGMSLTWILERLEKACDPPALLHAVEAGDESLCPRFVIEARHAVPSEAPRHADYVTSALRGAAAPRQPGQAELPEDVLDSFQARWREALSGLEAGSISVLEPACGSANDYRYIARCGLARFLRYGGFDICRKNVVNAHRRFPDACFFQANALEIPLRDDAADFLFVHDLFEHLSPQALETALGEVLRVTRRQAWLSFFNLEPVPQHRFRPVDEYHWNTLSLDRTVATLARRSAKVQVVSIADLAANKLGYGEYYNRSARTLIVTP